MTRALDRPIRVLIVDDSAIVRKVLSDALRADPEIDVVGVAADPFVARDLMLQHDPDVITLDIEMPRMDGVTFLRRIMAHRPLPVIVVSSVTQSGSTAAIDALAAGAIEVIAKPGGPYSVGEVADRLRRRMHEIAAAPPLRFGFHARGRMEQEAAHRLGHAEGLILVGASAGGTQAIEAVLSRMPAATPPVLIVQHMPAQFTRAFAARLDSVCAIHVVEARGGERLRRGTAYVAPGDFHLTVEAEGVELRTALRQDGPVHYQRPSVDVLFHSAARLRGVPIVALLLTGMGADGADGMVALRRAGAETIAEDEQSCVVFGMPAQAIARGGAAHVATLVAMPQLVADLLAKRQAGDRRAS